MTKEEEFELILDWLADPAYNLVIEDLDAIVKSNENINNIDNLLDLGRCQGRVEQLRFLMNLKEWYQNGLEIYRSSDASDV